jgi:CheY-like chemotaxis protein
MDLQLPGMDGIAALAALRADPRTKDIPVTAVTASAMSHHRPKILAADFDGYHAKPINVKEFLQVVREVLERCAGPGGGARKSALCLKG